MCAKKAKDGVTHNNNNNKKQPTFPDALDKRFADKAILTHALAVEALGVPGARAFGIRLFPAIVVN